MSTSVLNPLLIVSDIFKVLTVRERPYKSGMNLSEALRILGNFRDNGHIDLDLFDVFMRQKVCLKYAESELVSGSANP
jgi:HD-GYP domain-containing protein (c-di-GMP phosphodiesterase class II)